MQQIILNYRINKFGTYLFISKRVLYSVLWKQREKFGYFATYCTAETCILGEINKISKTKKILPRKKIALGLLDQRLGQISTKSLIDRNTDNVWKDIELRIDPDPFFTSCQTSSMNKRIDLKNR